jgi:hypothetical protein
LTPETVRCQLSPGMAVGAGGALTGGVNRLPPVGLIDFSVGDSGAVDDGVVVVVVVVVDSGAFSSPPPHAAVNPTIATIAVPPTAAAMRRARRFDLMVSPLLSPSSEHIGLRRIASDPARPVIGIGDALRAVVHRPHSEVGSDDQNLNALVKRTHNHRPAVSQVLLTFQCRHGIRLTVSVGECLLVVSNKCSKLLMSRMVLEVQL